LHAATEIQFPGAPEKIQFNETLRRLIDLLVTGLIEGTAEAAARVTDAAAVRTCPHRLARFTDAAAATSAALKAFLREKVYQSREVVAERERSTAMIADLFALYLKHPERMPEAYREQTAGQPLHRVVCDYMAGMTDGFVRRVWSALE
jgi:dGTPase